MEKATSILFTSMSIGKVRIRNRFVRSATDESMADRHGFATEQFVRLHEALAKGQVGLQITGHAYVSPEGKYCEGQLGLDSDGCVPGLLELTSRVHKLGGAIFVELSHCGSQSLLTNGRLVAPSAVTNPEKHGEPAELSDNEIWKIVDAFGEAARRSVEAGFDGIHLHAGHGYLMSEFSSPHSNRRVDYWGGNSEKRGRFTVEVYRAIRKKVGSDAPVCAKFGLEDQGIAEGLSIEEGLARAAELDGMGLDCFEVSCGLMSHTDSARTHIGVDSKRAAEDLLFHRIGKKPEPEAYFLKYAESLRKHVRAPLMLVGGIRRIETMARIISENKADFISMARPFIREPDLVRQIRNGRTGMVACTSCNICLMHEGKAPIRCWRKNPAWLAWHAVQRVAGRV
jgi:2,4-dienoyl-CoA reductase-like NADH-dependent reductase (Old Yellow Enzyme family)